MQGWAVGCRVVGGGGESSDRFSLINYIFTHFLPYFSLPHPISVNPVLVVPWYWRWYRLCSNYYTVVWIQSNTIQILHTGIYTIPYKYFTLPYI